MENAPEWGAVSMCSNGADVGGDSVSVVSEASFHCLDSACNLQSDCGAERPKKRNFWGNVCAHPILADFGEKNAITKPTLPECQETNGKFVDVRSIATRTVCAAINHYGRNSTDLPPH
jgi:hypothetical protein